MAFVLCLTLLPGVTALAANTIITCGSADELFAYMKDYMGYPVAMNGQVIALQGDVTLAPSQALVFSSKLGDEDHIMLDLNGKTLRGSVEIDPMIMVKKGVLTIFDSASGGLLENTAVPKLIAMAFGVQDGGTLRLESGRVKGQCGLAQHGGQSFVTGGQIEGATNGAILRAASAKLRAAKFRGAVGLSPATAARSR